MTENVKTPFYLLSATICGKCALFDSCPGFSSHDGNVCHYQLHVLLGDKTITIEVETILLNIVLSKNIATYISNVNFIFVSRLL